jgi:hypothetical protein
MAKDFGSSSRHIRRGRAKRQARLAKLIPAFAGMVIIA